MSDRPPAGGDNPYASSEALRTDEESWPAPEGADEKLRVGRLLRDSLKLWRQHFWFAFALCLLSPLAVFLAEWAPALINGTWRYPTRESDWAQISDWLIEAPLGSLVTVLIVRRMAADLVSAPLDLRVYLRQLILEGGLGGVGYALIVLMLVAAEPSDRTFSLIVGGVAVLVGLPVILGLHVLLIHTRVEIALHPTPLTTALGKGLRRAGRHFFPLCGVLLAFSLVAAPVFFGLDAVLRFGVSPERFQKLLWDGTSLPLGALFASLFGAYAVTAYRRLNELTR